MNPDARAGPPAASAATARDVGGDDSASTGRPTNPPLSILRVACDLYPDVTGGGAIHAHALSRQQAARGHDVTVLTSDHGNADRSGRESRGGYTVVRDREVVRPAGYSVPPGVLSSLLRRLPDADVVHAHSHLYFLSNLAAVVGRFDETPLVVTNHGLFSTTAPEWIQRVFIPTVARYTYNSADCVLCYSETDRELLREYNVTAPVEIVRNGVDCRQFTPGDRSRRRWELLYAGRVAEGKNLGTLLEAVAELATEYPDLGLRIVGDGPDRSQYETRCRELGIADRVTFVGEVSYDEMPRFYRESTAFVLPSTREGLPRTVLEAMACETPVVTAALPQLESIASTGGMTVEPSTAGGFAQAIRRLLDDESLRRDLGERGRRHVVDEYSWSRTVDRTTDLYYTLLD
jgi:glycosyltransferase involved in cell wall biosynthesis